MSTRDENVKGKQTTSSGKKRNLAEINDSEGPMDTTSYKGTHPNVTEDAKMWIRPLTQDQFTLEKGKDFCTARVIRGKISWEEVSIMIVATLGERYIATFHPADGLRCAVQAWTSPDANACKLLVFLYMHDLFLRKYEFPHDIQWQVGIVQLKPESLDDNCRWKDLREVNVRKKYSGWRFVGLLEFIFEIRLSDGEKDHKTELSFRLSLRVIVEAPPTVADQALALQQKLDDLYSSLKQWNVTINLRDATYRAHRSILGERAPALADMLWHTPCSKEFFINIEDCEPNAFAVFLLYVYSGKLEDLTRQNILDVYYIAIKYTLHELKKECFRYTLSNLFLDSVLSILAFGRKCDERMLEARAVEFFLENALQVLGREEWQRFEAENEILAAELRNMTLKYYRTS